MCWLTSEGASVIYIDEWNILLLDFADVVKVFRLTCLEKLIWIWFWLKTSQSLLACFAKRLNLCAVQYVEIGSGLVQYSPKPLIFNSILPHLLRTFLQTMCIYYFKSKQILTENVLDFKSSYTHSAAQMAFKLLRGLLGEFWVNVGFSRLTVQ